MSDSTVHPDKHRYGLILVTATLLMAVSGLIYELLAGTLSSYLLGNSVTQFSLVIGCFLSSMGIGSWLSRFINKKQLVYLIAIEIAVGFIGGLLTLIGFMAFTYTDMYQFVLLGMTCIIGILVGLEIPLVIVILKNFNSIKITVANVLSADYIGALVASILFPFFLLPHLGMNKAGIVAGAANIFIALLITLKFKEHIKSSYRALLIAACSTLVFLGAAFFTSEKLVMHMEDSLYQDNIIFAKNSRSQRIILTRWRDDYRLYLNGHLQFSSIDEYRYHEVLVHLPMGLNKQRERVLILGGGDGLALRQVLKYPEVKHVTLVDLDKEVTDLFQNRKLLSDLNHQAFEDPRVQLINDDAMSYLIKQKKDPDPLYDVILIDLPDPSDPALAKLYAKSFYGLAAARLSDKGRIMVQSTSPFRAKEAFWCIHNTIASIKTPPGENLYVKGLHVMIPSFGTWGFNLASVEAFQESEIQLDQPCQFLTQQFIPTMFQFPADMQPMETGISTLNHPLVTQYYRRGYNRYFE